MKLSLLVLLSHFMTSIAFAHESDRDLTLRAANDELTLRVAELLEENKRLKEFAEKALVAKSNNKPVSPGCNPQDLRKIIITEPNHKEEDSAQYWLGKNQAKCTKDQLESIKNRVGEWAESYTAEKNIIRLLTYYIDQK